MSTPDLKPWQLQEAVRATLAVAPLFAGDEDEGVPAIPVIAQDGTKKDEVESALSNDGPGACIEIGMPHDGPRRAQQGRGVIMDNAIIILVRINPRRNAAAANLNAIEAVCAVITALVRRDRHPGGEFLQLDPAGYQLERFDEGLIVYSMGFSKEATL